MPDPTDISTYNVNLFEGLFDDEPPSCTPGTLRIHWRGTHVCADTFCTCGHHGHIDDAHCYLYQCSACGAKFAVGHVVKLIPLTRAQADYLAYLAGTFKTDTA